jgi:hypothetical protein
MKRFFYNIPLLFAIRMTDMVHSVEMGIFMGNMDPLKES